MLNIYIHKPQPIDTFNIPTVTTETGVTVCPYLLNTQENKGIKVRKIETYYTTTSVNVRTKPTQKSKSVKVLGYCTEVRFIEDLGNGWSRIFFQNHIRYVCSKYISKNKPPKQPLSVIYSAPTGHHPKTFMDWDCITSVSSKQYQLKQQCYIGEYGIIMHEGRYCVALGTGYLGDDGVGRKFDLVLKNGTIIKCIALDIKANQHTNSSNTVTVHDNSIAEFVVNTSSLTQAARRMGDISYSCDEWNSEIESIKVYE